MLDSITVRVARAAGSRVARAIALLVLPAVLGGCGVAARSTPPTTGRDLSIRPTRTISFETSEGTGMNVDLSPDGRTIVFDLLGDLYTVPVAGGRATQLTRGLGVDRRPVWSPDGKSIAYISDATGAEALWLVDAHGTDPRPVIAPERPPHPPGGLGGVAGWSTTFTEVEWAAHGRHLVSDDTLYDREGGEPPRALGLKAKFARFSRNGRYIDFIPAEYSYSEGAVRYVPSGGLRRHDRTTGETVDLAPDLTDFTVREPVVSPDGTWLAYLRGFGRNDTLWVRHLATDANRALAHPLGGGGRLVFTADSREVILNYGGKLHRIEVTTGKDVVIPFRARVQVDLGPLIYHQFRVRNDSVRVRHIRSPDISPDGKRLVFSALQRLYAMALPHGRPRVLVEQEGAGQFQPAYSPDGHWIAYVTWSDVEGGHVWRIPSAGGRPERLTSVAGYYERPAWSPDGSTLAVLKGGEGNARPREGRPGALQLVPSTGGTPRTVVDSMSRVTAATFSPDGRRLLFMTQEKHPEGGVREIGALSSVRLDGGDRRVIARLAQPIHSLGEIILPSPDGRYVLFSDDRQLYLTRASALPESAALDWTEAVQLTKYGALDPRSTPDGRTLTWVVANQVFRIDPDRAMAQGSRGRQPRHVGPPPDQVISIKVTLPRHTARGTLALRGARVITMGGNEFIEDATILIHNDRIAAVGPTSSVVIPPGATTLDVRGKTIMPGLVDLHAHLKAPSDENFFQHHWAYLANLAYGVTTARGASEPLTQFGDAELIEVGRLLGPRVFNAGPSVIGSETRIESLEDARTVVQHRKAMGAVVVKQYEGRTRRERQWVHRAADEAGLNVIGHGGSSYYLDMVLDGVTGVEHWVSSPYEDAARLRAEARTWHTPTFVAGGALADVRGLFLARTPPAVDVKHRRFVPAGWINRRWDRAAMAPRDSADAHETLVSAARMAAAIVHRGGHVTMGSHGDDQGIGAHWELWALELGGLTNHEALRAATLHGAAGLGMQQDLGSLEAGKIADLVVLDENPLEKIEHTLSIRYVMKNGVLYDGDTLDTLWPAKQSLPAWMYQDHPSQ